MPELNLAMEPSPSSKRRGEIDWHVAASSLFGEPKKNGAWSPGTLRKEFLDYAERGDVFGVKTLLGEAGPQIDINWKHDDNGDSALMRAARSQDEDMVRLLLMNGADVTLKNNNRQQALEVSPFHIQELLLCPSNKKLFAHAAWQGDDSFVRSWLKRRPNYNAVNSEGRPALLLLAESPRVFAQLEKALLSNYKPDAVVHQLASHKSDMTVRDAEGRSALHLAVETNSDYALSIAVALVDKGLHTDARDHTSATPLHTAATHGNTNMMEFLLKKGADVNATDQKGSSPLHRSAIGGHTDACTLLLQKGADPSTRDGAGQCPHDLAASPGLHKRLKQAWQESSLVRDVDSRLASSGIEDEPDSEDSIDDETLSNIGGDYDSEDSDHRQNGVFITEKSTRSIRPAPSEYRRRRSRTTAEPLNEGQEEYQNTRQHEDQEECQNTRQHDAPGKAVQDSSATLSASPKKSGVKTARAEKGNLVSEASSRGKVLEEEYEPDFCSESDEDDRESSNKPTSRGREGVRRQSSNADRKQSGSESPKKQRKKQVRKQAAALPDVKNVTSSPGKKSKTASAKASQSVTSVLPPEQKTRPKITSSRSLDVKSKAPSRRTAGGSQVNLATAKHDISVKKKVMKKSASLPLRQQAMVASKQHHDVGKHHVNAQPGPIAPDYGHTTAEVSLASNSFQDNQGTLSNSRRDPLPALGARPTRKSASQPESPSLVVPSTLLQISFDNPKQPVLTKWQHDPQYLRGRGKAENDPQNQHSPPILLKRLPGGGGGGGGGAGASKALPKCEPELMLPLLHPNSARKMGMGGSPLRSRSKTLSKLESSQSNLSGSSLTASHVSLVARTSRSDLAERPPNLQRGGSVELPHIPQATSRSAVHSQGSDQLKSPSARSHGSARHQPLAPLSSAGKNRGSEEHEFLGVDDVLGLSSSSAASYQSSSSEDWTGSNKILITEQNVTDIVSSLGINGLNASALMDAAQGRPHHTSLSPIPDHTSPLNRSHDSEAPNIHASAMTGDMTMTAGSLSPRYDNTPHRQHSGLARGNALPADPRDCMDLILALQEAQREDTVTPINVGCLSPIQRLDSVTESEAGDSPRFLPRLPHYDEDDEDVEVDTEENDYSPVITAYIGPSRPASRLSVMQAATTSQLLTRPSTATTSTRSLLGPPCVDSLSSSNFSSLMQDDDPAEDEMLVFRKGHQLGAGGFGKVYQCMLENGQTIAMKEMELSSATGEAEKEFATIHKEVSCLKLLDHINIVKYMGASLCDGCSNNFKVRIFMELIAGGSIADLVKQSPLSTRVCRVYTKQILLAVEYLHNLDIIHRDIKGANIMVATNGIVKLIDFGTAKHQLQDKALSNYVKGTPYWVAPEVIREGTYDKPVDIWSVGCTVFEMAFGHHPWYGWEVQAAYFAIGNYRTPEELDKVKISSIVRDFIVKCMTREPEQRPSATELLQTHKFMQFQNKAPGRLPWNRQPNLPEKLPPRQQSG